MKNLTKVFFFSLMGFSLYAQRENIEGVKFLPDEQVIYDNYKKSGDFDSADDYALYLQDKQKGAKPEYSYIKNTALGISLKIPKSMTQTEENTKESTVKFASKYGTIKMFVKKHSGTASERLEKLKVTAVSNDELLAAFEKNNLLLIDYFQEKAEKKPTLEVTYRQTLESNEGFVLSGYYNKDYIFYFKLLESPCMPNSYAVALILYPANQKTYWNKVVDKTFKSFVAIPPVNALTSSEMEAFLTKSDWNGTKAARFEGDHYLFNTDKTFKFNTPTDSYDGTWKLTDSNILSLTYSAASKKGTETHIVTKLPTEEGTETLLVDCVPQYRITE